MSFLDRNNTHLVPTWAWVDISLMLGVIQTLINSMKLFQ